METEHKGFRIEIDQDLQPISPLEFSDYLGTIVCVNDDKCLGHRQTNDFGDYFLDVIRQEVFRQEVGEFVNKDSVIPTFQSLYVILPIYEHNNSISTNTLLGDWDVGRIGFIYVSRMRALEEFEECEWSRELENRVKKHLISEIEEYNMYLRGDVYFVTITDTSDGEVLEQVGNVFGLSHALQLAHDSIDSIVGV